MDVASNEIDNLLSSAYEYLLHRPAAAGQYESFHDLLLEMLRHNYRRESLLYWMFSGKYDYGQQGVLELWQKFDPATNLQVEYGASLMACCHMMSITDSEAIARDLLEESLQTSEGNAANLKSLVRTLQYIGNVRSVELLVRLLNHTHAASIGLPNWTYTAIGAIGHRELTTPANLTFGLGPSQLVAYLACCSKGELYASYTDQKRDLLWSEAGRLIELLDDHQHHVRVLALRSLVNNNIAQWRRNEIEAKLTSWNVRSLTGAESQAVACFRLANSP